MDPLGYSRVERQNAFSFCFIMLDTDITEIRVGPFALIHIEPKEMSNTVSGVGLLNHGEVTFNC